MASTQSPAPHLPPTATTPAWAGGGASDGPGASAAASSPLPRGRADALGAAGEGAGAGDVRRLLLFAAGGRIYGADITTIREIVPFRRCTRLPGAPAYVCGLINLRGTLVTVVDLAARLDGVRAGGGADEGAASRSSGSIVLVEHGAKVVGLAVDQVRDVQAVPAEELEPVAVAAGGDAAPSSSAAPTGGAVAARGGVAVYHGSGQLDGAVVVVLDVHTILGQVLA